MVLEGKYTDGFLAYAGADAPKFTAEELKIIGTPNDFVGLNIYAPQYYVTASDRAPGFRVLPFPTSFPHMNSEWLRVGPEVIYWAPRLAAKIWNIDTIYISENGTSSEERLPPMARSTTSTASCSCAITCPRCSARSPKACRSAAIFSGA